jgi:hypothetical protein
MVHFFGILNPGKLKRRDAEEAPAKASFFGGMPDATLGAVPMSRLEQDACYLNGKSPEPDEPGKLSHQN